MSLSPGTVSISLPLGDLREKDTRIFVVYAGMGTSTTNLISMNTSQELLFQTRLTI
jgi:hypothetical protein